MASRSGRAGLTLAHFSEAFLLLRVQQHGSPLAATPLVWIVMAVVYASLAYPFGKGQIARDPMRPLEASLLVPMGGHGLQASRCGACTWPWPGV